MVLSKTELITALQAEVRIVLHLAGKIDRTKLDYRPTPKQRSTIELLRYLSMMGPTLVRYLKTQAKDAEMWMTAAAAADRRDCDQAIAAIAAQAAEYAELLGDMSEADLRVETMGVDGSPTTRGAALVTGVLASCTAYRMQLFLYLKSSGREDLGTMNLWAGIDAPPPAA
jgi:hypothetical protein